MVNPLRFDRITVISLWPRFLAHPVYMLDRCKNMSRRFATVSVVKVREKKCDRKTAVCGFNGSLTACRIDSAHVTV